MSEEKNTVLSASIIILPAEFSITGNDLLSIETSILADDKDNHNHLLVAADTDYVAAFVQAYGDGPTVECKRQ